ncbi:D-isomer specific 2-hydroxyacid dehydrogenase family protein [Acinetobacter sp.]|uniref:D-isomer specific 2-hydroxyacid dehydrogenase family protein n=1 Tax=Acinetobacter sp. TaxID=472 RepID=UPI000C525530|nr:D-isomer specific 2-hydroxyacid dehydrogenase family protein [Acinetobacter sp.]MBC70016.1 4-phosphoerythronate dehydrogenase [Acinetobacter sp.]
MYKIICTTPVKHLPGVFDELKKYGSVEYCPSISKKNLIKKLREKNFDALFVNPNKQGYVIDENILNKTNIKIINTCSTGTNHIDINYCRKKGIKVYALTKDKSLIKELPSTSELAFGLMISILRNITNSNESVKKNKWDYFPYIGRQIKGLNICVVGYGRLGKIFCRQLNGFEANIYVVDPYVKKCNHKLINLNNAIKIADVLVLHVHLNSETKKLINKINIKNFKKNAVIVNTSRGEIVDEKELIRAIRNKNLGGYGTDVLSGELGDLKNNPVIKALKDNLPVVITPHIGGMTIEGQTKAFLFAAKKFAKFY